MLYGLERTQKAIHPSPPPPSSYADKPAFPFSWRLNNTSKEPCPKTSQNSMMQPDGSRTVHVEENSLVFVYSFLWERWRGTRLGFRHRHWQMEILKGKKVQRGGDKRKKKRGDSGKMQKSKGNGQFCKYSGCAWKWKKHKQITWRTMLRKKCSR